MKQRAGTSITYCNEAIILPNSVTSENPWFCSIEKMLGNRDITEKW